MVVVRDQVPHQLGELGGSTDPGGNTTNSTASPEYIANRTEQRRLHQAGAIALTRMPNGAKSRAAVNVSATTPALEDEYAA